MSELRHNPMSGDWVIIAPQRADRPQAMPLGLRLPGEEACPFCAGHELETPEPVLIFRDDEDVTGAGCQVRVVPNKDPALQVGDAATPRDVETDGAHERAGEILQHDVSRADSGVELVAEERDLAADRGDVR